MKLEALAAGHPLGRAGKGQAARDRTRGTVGPQRVETRDTEHRVLQTVAQEARQASDGLLMLLNMEAA